MLGSGIFRKRPRTAAAFDGGTSALTGFFEGRHGDRLTGWAFDRSAPGQHVSITLRADGGAPRIARADVYRADLYKAGFGDGHMAFSAPLAWFSDTASVRAFFSDGRELPGSPALPTPPAIERIVGSLHVRLDPPTKAGLTVSGSVFDAADPERRCRVAIRLGGRDHGAIRATLYRPGLSHKGVDALHGFRIMLDAFDMKPKDRIELVDGDTGAVLARLRN